MEFLSFNKFRARSIFYLIGGGLIPVIYIIFLLMLNYQNNLDLQESSIKRLRLDNEKQAATIGYFFLERKYDIRTIAKSTEVMTYFGNRDMGMSELYGLKVSLFSIHQLMQSTFRNKTINNDSIYKNFTFINSDKKTLINMVSPSQAGNNLFCKLKLDNVKDGTELIFEKAGYGYEVLLAAPCFFKKKISGWIVARLNLPTLHKNFMGSTIELSSRVSRLTLENGKPINSENKTIHDSPLETFQGKIEEVNDNDLIFINDILQSPSMMANRIQIQPLPLFLTVYVSKKEIMGNIETWQYLAGTGALIFLLLFGLGLFIQTDTKHLILKTRFDESKKQHDLLTKKNRELKKEINKRQKAENETMQAQKIAAEQKQLALIGQVAGKMAHDFNNILGIIMGNAELSILDCKDLQTRETLELIFEQTVRGKNLTKNLVAFAKSQEPKQEFFKINEKSDLVLDLLKKDLEGIVQTKDYEANMPDLLADPGMIEHALVNLIQNSIHALSRIESPVILIRTYCKDDNLYFEIEDNGCGISKNNLEKIYEPSFSLKGSKDVTNSYKTGIKGTGYGMANVKKYIEQNKGTIQVESEFDSGTKITVSLPVIRKKLTTKEKIKIQERITHFEKHILLVEDEMAISDVQYKILTQAPCNHKVDIANNGKVAMDLFDRNEYDFVSLDYILPRGINGMDVYHHIRETNKAIPILFISGNIEFLESIKELKQKDPYIDHQSKPCMNIDYVNCINKLLGI